MPFLKHHHRRWTYLIFTLFVLNWVGKALINHLHLQNASGDIAIFVQMFFHTIHGDFMFSTFEQGNHLGVHFSPILILLTPVMAIAQSPLALMMINGCMLSLAIFWLTKHLHSESSTLALVVISILSLHPTLQHDVYKNFHALSMMSLPFVGVYISYTQRKFKAYTIWLLVLLLIRENMFLTVFCWASIAFFQKQDKKWFLIPLTFSFCHFIVANVIVPTLIESGIRPSIFDYYQAYGSNPGQAITTVMADPLLPFRVLFTAEKANYLLRLLAPFLIVLPFTNKWWLPAVPTLAAILFSSNGRLTDPRLHFSVEIVWWLAIASIQYLRTKPHLDQGKTIKWIHLLVILYSLHLILSVFGHLDRISKGFKSPRYEALTNISQQLEPSDRVVAKRYLANHLAWREEIYFLGETEKDASWDRVDVLVLEEQDLNHVPPNWQRIIQEGRFHVFIPTRPHPSP